MDPVDVAVLVPVMPVERLFAWWNAVYTLPLAFVLIFLTITSIFSLLGGVIGEFQHGDAQAEADHDVGVEHDADLDHDIDLDHDVDLDADGGPGLEGTADAHDSADLDCDGHISPVEEATVVGRAHAQGDSGASGHNVLVSGLVALGVGRAPLVMLLQILILLWGIIGAGLHQVFHASGPQALLWSFPATLTLSVLGTRTFALLFGRFFKQETYAVGRNEVVGRTGRVVFPVTEEEGTVHVRDGHGTLHRLRARCSHGRLESGREIIILGYDPERKLYQVDDSSMFVDRACQPYLISLSAVNRNWTN